MAFLPESWARFLRDAAARLFGACLSLAGIALAAALVFHNPYLDGVAAASNFGQQSFLGNIVGGARFAIGWLPALFAFLFIARLGAAVAFRWDDQTPEYDIIKSFVAASFGAAGLGTIMPSASYGGFLGAVASRDLHVLLGGGALFAGVLFVVLFLLMAGIILRIKKNAVVAAFRSFAAVFRWLATALHLREAQTRRGMLDTGREEKIENRTERKARTRKSAGKNSYLMARAPSLNYKLPDPLLLEKSVFSKNKITDELKRNASAMEINFANYGVMGHVAGIKPGPIVTLYEFEPDDGMRIAKITDTVQDMTRAMATEKIRIAHIPGTKYIGVEMVNMQRQPVRLQNLMSNPDFMHSPYKIPLALGVNIGGSPVIVDLAKMPHALVAGRTGSGKSVFVQSIIMSIVYRWTPDECKLIIIDPKGVDFTLWRDIPHLLTPVVTDATQAVNVLKWSVREMEDRYKKLKDLGVQNIEGYNEECARLAKSGKKITRPVAIGTDPETGALEFEERQLDLTPMPYLVIIIDEVADLMSVARKEIEACVQRLAQKARAAGMHLVAATQRPDTSVITGVIKANFPTRISFQARSNIDSMTTLGEKGAEQLLSCGDMLFSEAGKVPVRIHGALIENKEINRVADCLREQGEPNYKDGVGDSDGEDSGGPVPGLPASKDEKDGDLYRQAVEIVVRDKKPTISYLQRRLQIGYNKAAMLIERMEREKILSAPDANNKRHIL